MVNAAWSWGALEVVKHHGSDLNGYIRLGLEKGPGGHVEEPQRKQSRRVPGSSKANQGWWRAVHLLSVLPTPFGEGDGPCNHGDWSWKAIIHSNHSVTLAVAA